MRGRLFYFKTVLSAVVLMVLGSSLVLGADFNWRKYEGTTIRVLGGKSAFTPIQQKQVEEFQKLTGITVKAEYYPSNPLRQKLIMELGAGNKDLDVFGGMMKTAYQYDAAGWLEPLDKYINDPALTSPEFDFNDFFARTIPRIKGRIIGLAGSGNPQLLMYRKDLFEQYNIKVPTNWQELEAAAQTLKKNLPPGQFAWVVRMDEENTAPFGPFLYSNGGSWLDEKGKPVFNSKAAVEAMQFYGKMAREYGPPGGATLGWKEVIGAVAQGKAAMTSEISIFANLILENPKQSTVAGKMGYALVPPGIPGNYVNVLPLNITHISALSEKKEAAWLYLQHMSLKEQSLPYKLAGLPTMRKSDWQNPVWKEKDKLPELSELQYKAIENGMIGFEIQIPKFTEARQILQRVIYTAYENGDVQKAADEAVKEVEKLID
jgi:multiple sugar transport system substrate-binding protein